MAEGDASPSDARRTMPCAASGNDAEDAEDDGSPISVSPAALKGKEAFIAGVFGSGVLIAARSVVGEGGAEGVEGVLPDP